MNLNPYFETENGRIIHGDSRIVVNRFPENHFDAIVTDPPYGLNDGRKGLSDIFFSELFNVFFPKFYKEISKVVDNINFSIPRQRISFLNSMNRAVWVEPSVGMIESSIDLNDDFVDWNEEIKNTPKPTEFVPDGKLMDIRNSHRIKHKGNFFLKLRNCVDSPLSDSSNCGFADLGFGRIGVAIVIPFRSCFASLLRALAPASSGFLGDIIRFLNDSTAMPERSSFVMTSTGAELRAMLSLDTLNATAELLPAGGTNKFDAVFELVCPKDVGTITGTSSLASMFKANLVSFVNQPTSGAFSLNMHKFIVPYINRKSSGFMNKKWDYDIPSVETFKKLLRVAKPGATLLCFAGCRTQHRMGVNIEDAGWILKDTLMYLFGSGFPKAADVSKNIDKKACREQLAESLGRDPTKDEFDAGWKGFRKTIGYAEPFGREGRKSEGKAKFGVEGWETGAGERAIDAPTTPEAELFQGYKSHSLKPAYEPIILAMKPNEGNYAENALKYGVSGINIDACRVGTEERENPQAGFVRRGRTDEEVFGGVDKNKPEGTLTVSGRFPSNVILSYAENEYMLKSDITLDQKLLALKWLYENA